MTPPPREPERNGLARLVAINASALTLGRLLNAGLGLVAVGITSRYLGVDEYGTLITIVVFTTLLTTLTDLGVWTIGAREIARRPDETPRLMGALFTIGIGLSLLAAALGLIMGFLIYPSPADDQVREGIAILVLAPLPLAAAAAPAGAYLIALQRGYAAAVASTVASIVMTLLLVATVSLDLGFTAVVVANAAQSIAFAAVILAYALPRIRFRPRWDPPLVRDLLRWAFPLGVVYALMSLYWRIDVVLLSLVGSHQAVGIYGLAYKVVDTLYVLPAFVTLTLLPEFARLANDTQRRDELVEKASAIMQVAALPLVVFMLAFAGEIVEIGGGDAFDAATVVLRILAIGVGVGFLRAVFTEALIAANRQSWLMYAMAVLLGVNVALNLALIPELGARGAALAFAASEVLALVLVLRLFRRIGTVPAPRRLKRIVLAGAAMAVVTLLKLLPLADAASPAAVIAVLGSLSLAVYVSCLYALGAMPREVHSALVAPALTRLRALRGSR